MGRYKLYCLNRRGRAELARLIFAVADQEYEDVRIEEADYPAWKPKFLFNQVPALEVDGVQIAETHAFTRYLARTFGLAGETELDKARADMIVDAVFDLIMEATKFLYEQDPEKKAEKAKVFFEEKYTPGVVNLEKLLHTNPAGRDYFVGNALTWADLSFFNAFGYFLEKVPDCLDKTPLLKALHERVNSHPKVAAWLEKRPVTAL